MKRSGIFITLRRPTGRLYDRDKHNAGIRSFFDKTNGKDQAIAQGGR